MDARRMARAVAWLHWALTVFLLAGIPMQMVFPRYGPIQIGALALTLGVQKWVGHCPLTILEDTLHAQSKENAVIRRSFLAYHAEKWCGIRIPPGCIPRTLYGMLAISLALWISPFLV